MSDNIMFKLNSFDDLKQLPEANVTKFIDGPMQGQIAGIKIKLLERNCWYGEPKVAWDKKDFCEKIVVWQNLPTLPSVKKQCSE
jgi:hypothetical protein